MLKVVVLGDSFGNHRDHPRLDAVQEHLEAARLALRQDLRRPALRLAKGAAGLLQAEARGKRSGRWPGGSSDSERERPA